jgi:flagellar basal body P-ring protein FlgI
MTLLRVLRTLLVASCVASLGAASLPSQAAPRIKDISDFEGMRDNMLVG